MTSIYPVVLGLTGKKGSGKDTVADFLCEEFGFRKIAFADALYEELADAFAVTVAFLRTRATKETPCDRLAYERSADKRFLAQACASLGIPQDEIKHWLTAPRSPRQALQDWGTAYRRAQDPMYWVKIVQAETLKEHTGVVLCDVRAENEKDFIKNCEVPLWKVESNRVQEIATDAAAKHVSETTMDGFECDWRIRNNGTLEDLRIQVATAFHDCPGCLAYGEVMPRGRSVPVM